ncbi:MAG: efflux RND transporter permease subunit [Bacteroidales bacterium]|nr:efflux RND transporter permease subunit [Bacteroidales bacterium]
MAQKNKFKEFFATSWAIDNKTSIYVLALFISLVGYINYVTIPKEQFPEVVIPYIMVNTPYPGTSPEDMENLVTRPIEKQLKSISDVKKISSTSVQDFSTIVVEFTTDIDLAEAKQRVRDAVDKSKPDLPNDLPDQPQIADINLAEFPIMFINISGNYDLERLKKYAEKAQDRIESLKEITRVDIVGALEREIQIDADMFKMQAASVTFGNIEQAVAAENLTISGGSVPQYGMKRNVRVRGQFITAKEIENLIVHSSSGAIVFLKDIATVTDSFKEKESYSRVNGQNVITLNIIKKSGENLIDASDKIKKIFDEELIGKAFPNDLSITITGDQSRYTRNTLEELNNTIIIGFILVTIVLMFFMGFANAFFVGLAVPLSMAVAYLVIPGLGFSMNMIVMFGFIFALGIVVDDAIVVIENTHRIHRHQPDIKLAAKQAAGEVFLPILSGTLTTLAPFVPLAFWPGIVGEFMYYMPVTLILSLFASLFVAYVINPVFAVSFMKHEYDVERPDHAKGVNRKMLIWGGILAAVALMSYVGGATTLGNTAVIVTVVVAFFRLAVAPVIHAFQHRTWPWIMNLYEHQVRYFISGRKPYYMLVGMIALFFLTFVLVGMKGPRVLFFPDNEPNSVFVYIKMPEGTHQIVTDSVTRMVEQRVAKVFGQNNPDVESVIANVTIGAGEEESFSQANAFNRGKVTVNFVEHKYRSTGVSTQEYLNRIREAVKGIPGAEITVDKNKMGPPTGKPVNIEISSENLDHLIEDAIRFQAFLDSVQVPGIEELKSDFEISKPEIFIEIDRERAMREGISTGQIGMEIRTAIFGKEVSKFKEDEDEYPIQLRYSKNVRENINNLMNLRITYRDMNSGMLRSIPLSTVAHVKYGDSYGGINRKDLKRVITLYSNVLNGYTANEIVAKVTKLAANFPVHEGVTIALTGEQEDQAETSMFLMKAMLIAVMMIFFILITQFNSISKTIIILSEVLFSIIGVLLGVVIFDMDIVILMTGLGIVALAGIVVRNGILIVEFADVLKARGMKTKAAIVEAGKTRTTPVILTATATMLGLVPLAVGMNINFVTLFTSFDPQIHFGGDNVAFWGPLAWTIIFGLSFATFLTLIFVPAMYLIAHTFKIWVTRKAPRLLSFRRK